MSEVNPEWVLYHNGQCSKSRKVKEMLVEADAVFSTVNYLEDPPSPRHLLDLCEKGGFSILQLVRFGEPIAAELGLSVDDQRSAEQWSQLLHDNPVLIERPIVETPTRCVIGRPPESVRKLWKK